MSRPNEGNSHYDYHASRRGEPYTSGPVSYAPRPEALPPPPAGHYYGYPPPPPSSRQPYYPEPQPQPHHHQQQRQSQQHAQQPQPQPHHAQWQGHPAAPHHEARRYAEPYPPTHPEAALRGPPTQAGYQQPPAPPYGQPYPAGPFPSSYGPRTRRRPKEQARAACSNCKRDHVSCDNERPCRRCVAGCKESTCEDVPPKKRGRPKVRIDAVTPAAGQPPMLAVRSRNWQATDQTEISTKDDIDGPGLAPSRPVEHSGPAKWETYRNQTLPPLTTTTSGSSSTSPRPNTVAGSDPSPVTLAKLGSFERPSPTRLSHLAESWDSRSATTAATPPDLSPRRSQFGAPTASSASSDAGRTLNRPVLPAVPYQDRNTAALPPISSTPRASNTATQPGPTLPPLSSLESVRPANGLATYNSSSRATASQAPGPPSSYTYKESQRSSPRPGSRGSGSNSRGRSVDSHGSADRVKVEVPAAAGQRRPSQGDPEVPPSEVRHKRQKLTLGEIMH